MEKNEAIRFAIEFFRIDRENLPRNIDDLVSDMDEARVAKSVILGQDLRSVEKSQFKNYNLQNEELKKIQDAHPERFICFGAIDPRKEDALAKL
jgi:predicted TIM-barrel fold metal-dependent hydrolase